MKRLTILAIAFAALTGGVLLVRSSFACSGSFQFHYTSPLSPIISMYAGGADTKQCEYLVMNLLDLEVAAAQIGVSQKQLTRRLEIDAFPSDALAPDCRVTYRGESDLDTVAGLQTIAVGFVKGMSRQRQEEQVRVTKFIEEARAELIQRRNIAQSSIGEATADEKQSKYAADVDDWTVEEYVRVLTELGEALATLDEQLNEASCVEYLVSIGKPPTDQSRALEATCRNAKPIGITQWPELSENCRNKTDATSNSRTLVWRLGSVLELVS